MCTRKRIVQLELHTRNKLFNLLKSLPQMHQILFITADRASILFWKTTYTELSGNNDSNYNLLFFFLENYIQEYLATKTSTINYMRTL